MAFLMHEVLEHAGFEVETTHDGVACLQRARETLPDLVVLDIMMPKMHGIDVLKALQADPETRAVGVLVCTAKDFPTEYEQAWAHGALGMIIKPFEPPELVDAVNQVLTSRGQGPAPAEVRAKAVGAPEEVYDPVLDTERGSFTMWGTRGAIPTPGAPFLRHGGNTSCLSVSVEDECFIFDAGSGIRELGIELMKNRPSRTHLFITHTHWDHIQGFPFFAPAYDPESRITIYGAKGFGKDLRSLFQGQLDRDYFPVRMEEMKGEIEFRHLPDEPLEIGPAKVSWEFAQHPGATMAYKIEVSGKSVAWVPDNEFLLGHTGDPLGLHRYHFLVQPLSTFIRFLAGVDLAIHEAQYTGAEYPKRIRWGHSSVPNAAALMKLAEVRRWIVTHHDPQHDDTFLEKKLNVTRQILAYLGYEIPVSHGYDGLTECF